MSMNNMRSKQQNTSQLTTQRTKENWENSLLSLTNQQKVWEEKFNPSLKWESYIYRIPRWPLGYIYLWFSTFPKCLLAFHIHKVTLGISLLFNYNNYGKYEDSSYSSFLDFIYNNNYNILQITFTIIYNFQSPFLRKCLLQASCCVRIFSSRELKIWAFFTSRAMLHFLNSSILITNLCTKAV